MIGNIVSDTMIPMGSIREISFCYGMPVSVEKQHPKAERKNHCTLDHVALNQTLRQKQNNEITSKLFFSVLLKRRRWDGDLILSLRFLTHRRIQTHDLASSPITTRPRLLSRKSFVVTKLQLLLATPGTASITTYMENDSVHFTHSIKVWKMGGSLGLVVIGGDSCYEGCGFESLHRILDGHFFTFICCKNCNFCLKR